MTWVSTAILLWWLASLLFVLWWASFCHEASQWDKAEDDWMADYDDGKHGPGND